MSVTFWVEFGNVKVDKNHNNARACDMMNRAGITLNEDLCGNIEHQELRPAIQNLLSLYQEAKKSLEDYEAHRHNSTSIDFDLAEYYEVASRDLIGLFSLAYTFGKDVYYS